MASSSLGPAVRRIKKKAQLDTREQMMGARASDRKELHILNHITCQGGDC